MEMSQRRGESRVYCLWSLQIILMTRAIRSASPGKSLLAADEQLLFEFAGICKLRQFWHDKRS
jgi:hypothetical protein